MATCKDCLHYEACQSFSKVINAARDVENGCEHFEKRSDFERVVRCRACYWGWGDLICSNPECTKSFYGCPVPPDHYCSYGRPKEEER